MKCFLCDWCKPEKDGPELGYVADVEHAADGTPLTGARLVLARIVEGFITEPFCWVVRKVCG
jgi:hypothetical protein